MNDDMLLEKYRQASYLLIQIIDTALHQKELILDLDEHLWKCIYDLSEHNHVEGITYLGVKNIKNVPSQLLEKWQKQYHMTVYRQFLFDTEREAILKEMDRKGLSYCPIKGIKLIEYYPIPGMRFMADNDMIYGFVGVENGHFCRLGKDEKEKKQYMVMAQEIMQDIMKQRGYDCKLTHGNADVFMKEPIYNFEMHRHLFISGQKNHDYYEDPWTKAKRCSKDKNEYTFSDEDEYIYLIAHTFKHFDVSGCGIRCLIDLFVFLDRKAKSMDWDYIEHELKEMELDQFHRNLKKLSLHCFMEGPLDQEDEKLLIFLMKSGTYGNMTNFFERNYSRLHDDTPVFMKKIKYIYRRLFLTKEECKDAFPFLYKHMYLMPIFAIYRIMNAIFLRPKKIFSEFKFILKKR